MEIHRSEEDDKINPWRDQKIAHWINGHEWRIESDELIKQAEKVQDPKEAADVIKKYEDIIRTKKKGIIKLHFIKERFSSDLKKRTSSSR